jgi:AcrR family transcriptional regulator
MANGRRRLSSVDRRNDILSVATRIFAAHGFRQTKVELIAKEAGVSPALVYRHFPLKVSLYRAVLRRTIAWQDERFRSFGLPEPTTEGLVRLIVKRMRAVVMPEHLVMSNSSVRLMMESLSSDGGMLRFVYRRVARLTSPSLSAALDAARDAGDTDGIVLSAQDALAFMEQQALMVQATRSLSTSTIPYSASDDALLESLVMFCARGIGLRSDAVDRYWPRSERKVHADATPLA